MKLITFYGSSHVDIVPCLLLITVQPNFPDLTGSHFNEDAVYRVILDR